jgi:hypothetical protein
MGVRRVIGIPCSSAYPRIGRRASFSAANACQSEFFWRATLNSKFQPDSMQYAAAESGKILHQHG